MIQRSEIQGGIGIAVRAAVLEIDLIRCRRIVARAIQRANQFGEAFVQNRLRNAFVSSAPDDDRRMVAKAQDCVAGILQKQRRVLDLNIVILR